MSAWEQFMRDIVESWDPGAVGAFGDWLQEYAATPLDEALGTPLSMSFSRSGPDGKAELAVIRLALGVPEEEAEEIAKYIIFDHGLPRRLEIEPEDDRDQLELLRKHLPALLRHFPCIDSITCRGVAGFLPEVANACNGLPIQPHFRSVDIEAQHDAETLIFLNGENTEACANADNQAIIDCPAFHKLEKLRLIGEYNNPLCIDLLLPTLSELYVTYGSVGGTMFWLGDHAQAKNLRSLGRVIMESSERNRAAHSADNRKMMEFARSECAQRLECLAFQGLPRDQEAPFLETFMANSPKLKELEIGLLDSTPYELLRANIRRHPDQKIKLAFNMPEVGSNFEATLSFARQAAWIRNCASEVEFRGSPMTRDDVRALDDSRHLRTVSLQVKDIAGSAEEVKEARRILERHNQNARGAQGSGKGT